MIKKGDKILFQGDSITDADRDRDGAAIPNDRQSLGSGYPYLIASRLLSDRPADGLRFINRGISGDRVVDLYARWKADAINIEPDLISILIGVNDTWHELEGRMNGVEVDRYETVFTMLLDLTRERLPSVRLVLCDPFVLKCGVVTDDWLEEMAKRRSIVAKLAADYGAAHVRFQEMFDRASTVAPPEHWAGDGVHPSGAGHARMADYWLKTLSD